MSTEVIVDKAYLQGQMNNILDVISFIENNGEYEVTDEHITLYYDYGISKKEIKWLDINEVQEKYPNVDLQTITIGGVTFVTAGENLVDCGIVREKSSTADTIVSAANSDLAQWVVETIDKLCETKLSGKFWTIAKIFWLEICINDAYTETGKNYDEVADMGEDYLGGLSEYTIGFLTNYAFRDQIKDILMCGLVELEMGQPVTIPQAEESDVIIIWSDEEGIYENKVLNGVYYGLQQAILLGIYNYAQDVLGEVGINEFTICNNVDINGDAVIGAQKTAAQVDPLILDLNGNNVFTTTVEDGTYFDFQEDGFKEKTAWTDEGDGFLVYDIDGNGKIDVAGELFGDRTVLADGTYAKNGYEAIKQYDTNNDGVINTEDEIFSKLSVWIDQNSNGITDEGELKTLEDLQIQSIGIAYNQTNNKDDNGNTILGQTQVTLNDGNVISMSAFKFQNDTTDTTLGYEIEIPEYIKYHMPNLQGSGNVLTLHQAMATNEELYQLVQQYTKSQHSIERYELAERILISWAGCGEEVVGSRGSFIDATHMAVIEKFFGTGYAGLDGRNPNNMAGPMLESVYQDLLSQTRNALILNTSGLVCMLDIKLSISENQEGQKIDLLSAIEYLDETYGADRVSQYEILNVIIDNLFTDGYTLESIKNDEVDAKFIEYGFKGIEDFCTYKWVYSMSKSNVSGSSDNEIIIGNNYNSTISGGNGNDII